MFSRNLSQAYNIFLCIQSIALDEAESQWGLLCLCLNMSDISMRNWGLLQTCWIVFNDKPLWQARHPSGMHSWSEHCTYCHFWSKILKLNGRVCIIIKAKNISFLRVWGVFNDFGRWNMLIIARLVQHHYLA